MTDFTNFPVWANSGSLTQPLFINSGWVCGAVDPNNMNWWFNRTDKALVELDTRVLTNASNIAVNTTAITNLSNSLESSGTLGVYVSDSSRSLSKSYTGASGSPGVGAVSVIKTFNHTIQNTGDIHLVVGYELSPAIIPASSNANVNSKHCSAIARLHVNNQIVIVSTWGRTSAATSSVMAVSYGHQQILRHINSSYNWGLINQVAFPTYKKGDVVQLKLDAYIQNGNRGTLSLGFVKLVLIEIRATDT